MFNDESILTFNIERFTYIGSESGADIFLVIYASIYRNLIGFLTCMHCENVCVLVLLWKLHPLNPSKETGQETAE